jgi:hypothetical protein
MVTSQSQATLQCSPGVMPCWLACLALGSIHTLPTFPPLAHLCLLLYKGSGPPCGAFTALTVTSVYNHRCSQRPPQLVCPRPHHSQRPLLSLGPQLAFPTTSLLQAQSRACCITSHGALQLPLCYSRSGSLLGQSIVFACAAPV